MDQTLAHHPLVVGHHHVHLGVEAWNYSTV